MGRLISNLTHYNIMKNKKYLLASSAATIALLVASPVLADSGPGKSGDGLHFGLGSIVRLLAHDRHDGDQGDKQDKKDHGDRGGNATSTANSSVTISGTIAAISGSQITVSAQGGTTYIVDASGAELKGGVSAAVLGDLRVGDTVSVHGKLNGSAIVASSLRDFSLSQRAFLTAIGAAGAGVVTAINGSSFTLKSFASPSTTVTTDASTTYKFNGQATSSSALSVGSKVLVAGTSTNAGIAASVVSIWNLSIDFLRHLFFR